MKKILPLLVVLFSLPMVADVAASWHESVVPTDTIVYDFLEAELNVGNISFQIHTEDKPEVYFSTIVYYESTIEGTYTEDDIAPYGACIRVGDKWVDAVRYRLQVTQQDYIYHARAEMLGNDDVFYLVTLTSHSLQPKRTVDIAINNMTIENLTATQGVYYLDGFNDQYAVSVQVTSDSIADGTFHSGVNTTITSASGSNVTGLITTLTLTTTASGRNAQMDILGKDTVRYRINMGYIIPATKDTVEIHFARSAELTHAKAAGNYQFYNHDNQYIAAIDIHTDTLGGTFRGDDIDKYYSFLGVIRTSDTLAVRVMDASVTLSQRADTTLMKADVVGDNAVLYRLSMFYVRPEAKDTVVLTIPNAQYNDLLSQGAYQVHGYTPDSSYYLSITPFATQVEGTFEPSDMYQKYSYIARFTAKDTYTRINFYDGEVVSTVHGRYLNVQGGILGKDTVFYWVNMSAPMPLQYDSVSGQVDFTYTTQDEVTINTAYLADSSMILFDAVAYGVINNTFIRFNTNTTDPVTIIPAGVYPINYSRGLGTVLAGGLDTDEQGNQVLAPSFFARTWMDGRVVPPLYFMVDGTVSVENRDGYLYVEVNAHNSYGRPVHIIYNSNPAPVSNVATEPSRANKVIENGQVIIRRGDEKFNILGTRIR